MSQLNDLKIKDLLIKLQVLVNGILEEREKSKSLQEHRKEVEESNLKKDSEIAEVTKEKLTLKSKLTIEKSKAAQGNKKTDSYFSSFFNKTKEQEKEPEEEDESKYVGLEEKLTQQELQIKDLTQKLKEEKEKNEQQAKEHEETTVKQKEQIEELTKNLQKIKKEAEIKKAEETQMYTDKIEGMKRKFNNEKDDYERQLAEIKQQLKDDKELVEETTKKLADYKDAYEAKKYENIAMKKQVDDLDSQLHKAKMEIKEKQLSQRIFQVEKVKEKLGIKKKKPMTITLNWNKSKNMSEVTFKRMKKGAIKEEVIDIMDIIQIKNNEKKHEYIDLVYKVSNIKYKIFYYYFFIIIV